MLDAGILAELGRIDALLVAASRRLHAERPADPGDYRGLFISDLEFQELLERPFGQPLLSAGLPRAPDDEPALSSAPWQHLVRAFGLTRFEQDALLLCLLPELDLKYDRILAYLQDDVTAKCPTVDLLLNLLCPDLPERIHARPAFEATGALARYGLLRIEPPAEGPDALLRRTATVAPDLTRWLLGAADAPPAAAPYWAALDGGPDLTVYPPEQQGLIEVLLLREPLPFWAHVHAQERWSALALAQDLACQRGRPLARLALDALLAQGAPILPAVREAVRGALLTGAVLAVSLPPEPNSPEEPRLPPGWDELLRVCALTAICDIPEQAAAPLPAPEGPPLFRVPLERPAFEARQRLWERALGDATLAPDADLAELAARYRLAGGQIASAAHSARALARQRDPHRELVTFEDLTSAARAVSSVRLGKLAQQIAPRHRWEDLVLPPDRIAQIHELCDQFRYRHIVYGAWALGARSARGQGLSALFAGPSGTGKTMAAEVIANDLALDLYRIDLSGVVSKYIGETEKNLDRIFELARDSNAILLFDEADALFGKRSETKDAHDRYANIEISYLLQKVEEYDGVVILTSNLRQNLDEAFLRRLQFSIEFPFPEREARLLIWQRSAPPELPLAPDVEWEELAERFKLSGGSIRNALVTAAFLAARDGRPVGMAHLLRGVRREFQKLGKLIDEDEFAPLRAGALERGSRR
jgi:hypothetical protein